MVNKRFLSLLISTFYFLFSVIGYTQAILCRNCETISMQSTGRYVAQELNGARITIMTVSQERSNRVCKLDETWGHFGAIAWVDGGCDATFRVCYRKGYNLSITCGAWWWPFNSVCKVPLGCEVEGVAIRDLGPQSLFCNLRKFEYTYDWFWRTITVSGLCRSQFYVGCRRC